MTVPSAPVTDTPVDGGGPTAQVAVDSIGSSTGYAAFPDPGQFVVSIPGLALGALAGGAGPLPPISLPSPPPYPFYVQSDAAYAPEASAGSGPYQLSASSDSGSSKAQAISGFQSGLSGNAALATSTATLTSSDAAVVAKAVADLEGLSIGPLTVGEIKSTATLTMDSTGVVTPSTTMEIAGMRIGGVSVAITPQGLGAGGPTYALPINPTLDSLLKASGITVQVVAAQRFPDRVIAPALQITFPFAMPFAVPNVGQFQGTATVIIGSATAQMTGVTADSGPEVSTEGTTVSDKHDPTPATARSGGDLGSSDAGGAALAGSSIPSTGASGALSFPTAAGDASGFPTGPTDASGFPIDQAMPALSSPAPQGAPALSLDVRSVYLVVVAGALTAFGLGQLIRRAGGRAWLSMGG